MPTDECASRNPVALDAYDRKDKILYKVSFCRHTEHFRILLPEQKKQAVTRAVSFNFFFPNKPRWYHLAGPGKCAPRGYGLEPFWSEIGYSLFVSAPPWGSGWEPTRKGGRMFAEGGNERFGRKISGC